MMIVFWCLIALLLLPALVLVLWPLRHRHRLTMILILFTLPLLALGLYQYWGNSKALAQWYQEQDHSELAEQFLRQYGSPDQIAALLIQRLQESPDNPRGWYLLGRLYLSEQRFDAASAAFSQAEQLDPDDLDIVFEYAQALYLNQDGQLDDQAKALLERILQQDPDQPDALNLLAADAYQQQDYAVAAAYWQRLLALYPPQAEGREILLQAIAEAQKALLD